MSRWRPLRHLALVTVALGVVLGSPAAAARQDARFAVVIEPPDRAEAALHALGDKG